MKEQENGFTIEPGASFTLEPGGPHVMMPDIDPAELAGSIELTFVFDATSIAAPAEVRPIGDDDDMDEMSDGES